MPDRAVIRTLSNVTPDTGASGRPTIMPADFGQVAVRLDTWMSRKTGVRGVTGWVASTAGGRV